jgi:hypothetical protein
MHFFQQLKNIELSTEAFLARLLGHLQYVTCMHFHFFHTQMIYFFFFSGESIEEVNAELDNLDRKDNFLKPFSCDKTRFHITK